MAYQRTTWRTEETPLSAANFNNIEDGIEEALDVTRHISEQVLDIFYPVGTYYHTSDPEFNPNSAWGGTWARLGEGQVLLSAGTNYTAGTEYGNNNKSYTPAGTVGNHKLTLTEIPAHDHGSNTTSLTGHINIRKFNGTQHTVTYADGIAEIGEASTTAYSAAAYTTGDAPKIDVITLHAAHKHASQGGSGNHNHPFTGTAATLDVMQKSTATCIWHRIA